MVDRRVLELIEQSLQQTLAQTPEGPASEPSTPSNRTPALAELLAQLDARLSQLKASVQRAEERTAAVDGVLAAGADEAQRWLARAKEWTQKLATPRAPSL